MSDERRQDGLLPTFRQEGLTVPVRDEYLPMIEEAEAILDHLFVRRELLVEALLHPSMREREHASYERLEFLGDAVLGLVVQPEVGSQGSEVQGFWSSHEMVFPAQKVSAHWSFWVQAFWSSQGSVFGTNWQPTSGLQAS